MEIVFVIGFFFVLLFTGVSLPGVVAALLAAMLLMLLTGLFAFVIKMLPWLLLAVAGVWLWRAIAQPDKAARVDRLKRKIRQMERRGG